MSEVRGARALWYNGCVADAAGCVRIRAWVAAWSVLATASVAFAQPSQRPSARSSPSSTTSEPEQAAAPEASASGSRQPSARVAVLRATPDGVDPVVGQVATTQVRETVQDMGYSAVPAQQVRQAVEASQGPPVPTPAMLWRVMHAVGASRAVHARVWAERGRYVVRVQVASADGTGPFVATGESGADDFARIVTELTRRALPRPGERREAAPPDRRPSQPDLGEEAFQVSEPPSRAPQDTEPPLERRWRVAVQTEAAIGTSGDAFYNHLAGGRFDFLFSRELRLGAYLGYANLKGRNGRANNLLTYLQIEDRVPVAPDSKLSIPLRLGFGYLPRNGPVLRLAAGLAYPLGDRMDITLDLVTPTFWVVRDQTLFSLNLAAELGWRF